VKFGIANLLYLHRVKQFTKPNILMSFDNLLNTKSTNIANVYSAQLSGKKVFQNFNTIC